MYRGAKGLPLLALVFLSLTAASCSWVDWRPRQGMENPERWLSEDTALLVRVPNVAESRGRWSETAMGKGWSDPAVEYWRSLQFDPALEDVLGRLGLADSIEVLDMIRGQAVFAVEMAPLPEKTGAVSNAPQIPEIAFYATADFGENAREARELIEKQTREVRETPTEFRKEVREILVHGERIWPGAAGGVGGLELCSAWLDDTWILASSPEALLDLLARRLGIDYANGMGTGAEEKRKKKPLRRTKAWRQSVRHFNQAADVYAYVDYARFFDVLTDAAEKNLALVGNPDLGEKLRLALDWLGLGAVDKLAMTMEMRGQGFYTRNVVTMREEPRGLIFLTDPSRPLRTPKWVSQGVDSYSAVRIRSPLEFKQNFVRMIQALSPEMGDTVKFMEKSFEAKAGVGLDAMLGSFGSEVAMISRPSTGMPNIVLLWEIRDAQALERSLEALRKTWNVTVRPKSYMGYHYQTQTLAVMPLIPIHTATIDDFFIVCSKEAWMKNTIDFRKRMVAVQKNPKLAELQAPDYMEPLLPLLDEPFGEVREGMTVVERGYSNPAPSMLQLNAYLPLMRPMLNLQLKMMDMPTIPSYVVSAIPPLLPFANQVFPSVTRTMQNEELIVTESWSAFDPAVSPLAASVFVIANKAWMKEK